MTLKIERFSGKHGTRIRLSGAFRFEQLDQVKAEIERGGATALDLEEVDLVDVESVRFLNAREAEGILVLHCSPYIREWMLRERAGKKKATGGLMPTEYKQRVVALLKSLETKDPAPFAYINPKRYIQHNLSVADGPAGVAALIKSLPPEATVNTIRVFQDGDFVFAHTEYNFFGPKIGFDVFRFENGRIVEHWDNLQETAGPNPSGHTMIDGPTATTDLDSTEVNRTLVRRFVDDILVNGRMELLAGYFVEGNYIQHNPQIPDKLSGLSNALQAWAEQGITLKFDRIHKVLAQGNFVLTISEGALGGRHTSFYDLFRVQDAKIAEHWDVLETVTPKEQWKNQNGKFGF